MRASTESVSDLPAQGAALFTFATANASTDTTEHLSITVQNLTGDTLNLKVLRDGSITDIKKMITSAWGDAFWSQRLYLTNSLDNDSELCGLVKDRIEEGASVIMLVEKTDMPFNRDFHGTNCEFLNDGKTLRRSESFFKAVAFSAGCFSHQGSFMLRIDHQNLSRKNYAGGLEIGVVCFDPETVAQEKATALSNATDTKNLDIPADEENCSSLCLGSSGQKPANTQLAGSWDPNMLKAGDIVRVVVISSTDSTTLEISVNDKLHATLVGLPLRTPDSIYAVVGVYGKTEQVSLLQMGHCAEV
jgi:hypothetical protein